MFKALSVVCARAGSKGLKNKCLTRINGRMTAEYAIEYSLSLGSGIKTVVSTDIKEIISFCRKNNIAFIQRDAVLCLDESRIEATLADAIEKMGKEYFEYCSLVYGNIPTRYPRLFHEALRFLEKNRGYDAVISMQNVEKFHPEWMFDFEDKILPVKRETSYRRQGLAQKMIHDGHTLIFRIGGFLKRYRCRSAYKNKYMYSLFGPRIKPLLNSEIIIDIDTRKDLKLVAGLFERDVAQSGKF